MKNLNFRLDTVKNVLAKLSNEFDVDKPELHFKNMKRLHGFYTFDAITLNLDTLHNNLAEAVRTVRHEFYHYLEDILSLPKKKSELKARRFEKNRLVLGILPKSQTKLVEVGEVKP